MKLKQTENDLVKVSFEEKQLLLSIKSKLDVLTDFNEEKDISVAKILEEVHKELACVSELNDVLYETKEVLKANDVLHQQNEEYYKNIQKLITERLKGIKLMLGVVAWFTVLILCILALQMLEIF